MPILTPAHASDNSSSGLSFGVWNSCPIEEYALLRRGGFFFFDDFHKIPTLASNTEEDGYWSYADSGCSVKPAAITVPSSPTYGGIAELSVDTTDNDEVIFGWGASATAGRPVVQIAPSGAVTRKVWYETRVAASAITGQSLYVGLAAIGAIATEKLFSDTALTEQVSGAACGFEVVEAAPASVNSIYRTTIPSVVADSASHTLVANTWVKLGMYYDGAKMYWYVDGVNVTPAGVAYGTSGFPDQTNLCPVYAIRSRNTTAKSMYIDWTALAYQIEG